MATDCLSEAGAAQGQISAEISTLEKAIEALANEVSRVRDRLGCVLRVEDNIKNLDEPEKELVPLAQELKENRHRIERETERLKSILSRLEL